MTSFNRRRLLTLGATAAAGVVVPTGAAAEKARPARVPRKKLGKTGRSIPILLLGGGSGFKSPFDGRISYALKHGVDYLDLARVYAKGRSEPHAASTLDRLKAKNEVWITSKSKRWDAVGFREEVTSSLAAIGRSHVDLYYLHGLDDVAPLRDAELLRTVDSLKKEGKIRFFGFSCHDGNVAELLHEAARTSAVDSVMFRYNFRQYGNKELNAAIDAAHRADVGLIAMKTQGSEASFKDAWEKFEQPGKWNKHQAVLKAVWADERITAAVSHMDDMEKLKQNVAAAVDRAELGAADWDALRRYAEVTRPFACDGCQHLCGPHVPGAAPIADTMRYLMYHDAYGERAKARDLFRALPAAARAALEHADFAEASEACPHGVDIAGHVRRARAVLA